MSENHPRLLTVSEFVKESGDWPTESALRWLLFNRDRNGFHRVIRRIGKRILIHVEAYYEWVEEQNAAHKGGK